MELNEVSMNSSKVLMRECPSVVENGLESVCTLAMVVGASVSRWDFSS